MIHSGFRPANTCRCSLPPPPSHSVQRLLIQCAGIFFAPVDDISRPVCISPRCAIANRAAAGSHQFSSILASRRSSSVRGDLEREGNRDHFISLATHLRRSRTSRDSGLSAGPVLSTLPRQPCVVESVLLEYYHVVGGDLLTVEFNSKY